MIEAIEAALAATHLTAQERTMILRLKSRLVSGLIVSAVGVTGAVLANAADTNAGAPAGPTGAAGAATQTAPTATPSGATANAPSPNSAGTPASESTMSPRGNPSTSTAATSGSTGPAETTKDNPAKRLFDQLDLNHDGSLSLEEFSRATFQQPPK
jgi:EF hand domain-containing protein